MIKISAWRVIWCAHWYCNYVPKGASVLYIGPQDTVLACMCPARGIGVCAKRYRDETVALFEWHESLQNVPRQIFSYIIIDTAYISQRIDDLLIMLRDWCDAYTRILVQRTTVWGMVWHRNDNFIPRPLLTIAIEQGGFECIVTEGGMVAGSWIPFVSRGIQGCISLLPVLRHWGQYQLSVLRMQPMCQVVDSRVSVIIPCRNEAGTIEHIVQRMPKMGFNTELIFVEGHSSDSTLEVLYRVQQQYNHVPIVVCVQTKNGKANAVWEGCARATGECIMIFDGDMTVLPEELPRFYNAFATQRGDLINGSRLLLSMESGAMLWVNWVVNHSFGWLFSRLLGQCITDTLCGTKVFHRRMYDEMVRIDSPWFRMDPFGDFAMLLAVAELGGKIIDMPVTYRARQYGVTQIQGFFRHGIILLRIFMCALMQRRFLMRIR